MSILIKGMDMPKHCADNCPLMDNGRCWGVKNQPEPVVIAGHKPSWCPLIEVKTPHGRLIDADALIGELNESWFAGGLQLSDSEIFSTIDSQPTEIESED